MNIRYIVLSSLIAIVFLSGTQIKAQSILNDCATLSTHYFTPCIQKNGKKITTHTIYEQLSTLKITPNLQDFKDAVRVGDTPLRSPIVVSNIFPPRETQYLVTLTLENNIFTLNTPSKKVWASTWITIFMTSMVIACIVTGAKLTNHTWLRPCSLAIIAGVLSGIFINMYIGFVIGLLVGIALGTRVRAPDAKEYAGVASGIAGCIAGFFAGAFVNDIGVLTLVTLQWLTFCIFCIALEYVVHFLYTQFRDHKSTTVQA